MRRVATHAYSANNSLDCLYGIRLKLMIFIRIKIKPRLGGDRRDPDPDPNPLPDPDLTPDLDPDLLLGD